MFGPRNLASFLHDAHFDAVSTNLNVSNEPVLQGLIHKSVVKSFNGELVGIVGYTFQRANETALVGKLQPALHYTPNIFILIADIFSIDM